MGIPLNWAHGEQLMTVRSLYLPLGLAALPAMLAGCAGEAPTTPAADRVAAPAFARMPGDPGAASGRQFFMVKLDPLAESGSRGMVHIDVVGGYLRVRIHSNGVEPGEHIPQHIHANSGCAVPGDPVINLDAGLTLTNAESPPVGGAFPVASGDGVINYEASRSLADLRAAWNSAKGTSLQTDAELLAQLDLANRNVHEHVAFGPPFPAVNCGPIDQVN